MARDTLSNQGPGKGGKKAPSGGNRGVTLALIGFTAVALVVVALFAVISTTGGGASNFTPNDQGLLQTGAQTPDFTADTVDGGSVSAGGGSSEATMLVFFATWCLHCQEEAPIISELENEYDSLKIAMVGIDGQDNPEKVSEFMQQYDIQSPAVYDPSLGARRQAPGVGISDGLRARWQREDRWREHRRSPERSVRRVDPESPRLLMSLIGKSLKG